MALSVQPQHPPPSRRGEPTDRVASCEEVSCVRVFLPPTPSSTSPVKHGGNVGYGVPSRPAADGRGVHLAGGREERPRSGEIREFHGRRAVAVHHFTVQPQDQALESLQRRKCRMNAVWMRCHVYSRLFTQTWFFLQFCSQPHSWITNK